MERERQQTIEGIRRFWDKAARTNAAWYVSSYTAFSEERDMDEFWRSGQAIWSDLKGRTGYAPQPTDQVVEIGCGIGRLSRAISPEVASVDAFDVSQEMLDRARSANLPNVAFRLGTGFSLEPVPDKSAQMVVAYCVFQHLPSRDVLHDYLVEMCRVAAPGGVVAFTLSKRDWKHYLSPILRLRALLREKLDGNAPKDVHRREWLGIRPTDAQVRAACPIELQQVSLDSQRQLFFGRTPLV